MKTKRKRIGMLAFIVMIAVLMIVTMQTPGTIADSENYQCQTYATVFALLPPVIAIGLAIHHFWPESLPAACYIPILTWS